MASKPKKKLVAGPDHGGELTLICEYDVLPPSAPKNRVSEIQALTSDRWAPATADFLAVAQTPDGPVRPEVRPIEDLNSFIAAICCLANGQPRTPRSLRRVNILGHGEPGIIGFSGSVDYEKGETLLGVENTADYLKGGAFGLATTRWFEKDDEGITYRDRIRSVLSNDAEIALVLCYSGSLDGGLLMERLAELFIAKVLGYLNPIVYHPKVNQAGTAIVDRRITRVGKNGKEGLGHRCWLPAKLDGKHLEFDAQPRFPVIAAAQAAGRAAWEASRRAGHLPVP